MNQRLMIYRQMASARREEELERTLAEVRDRYGPLPPSVLNLADYGRIRIMADRLGDRGRRPRGAGRRVPVPAAGEARSRAARVARATADRRHAGAAGRTPARSARRHRAGRGRRELRRPQPLASAGGTAVALAGAGRKPLTSPVLDGRGERRPRRRRRDPGGRRARRAARWRPGFSKAEILKPRPKTRAASTASLHRWAAC